MIRPFRDQLLLLPGLLMALAPAPRLSAAAPVSFSKQIAPILQAKCLTCHNPEKAKGGYRLHSYEALLKAGDSGDPAVTAGSPSRSKLHGLLVATDPDDRMPQKDDPLPPEQIGLIQKWIEEGALFDGTDPKASFATSPPSTNHPAPPISYKRPVPILALAFSTDGNELAASGYHEVTVWHPVTGGLLRRVTNIPQHTQALSYSPNGSLLAVAGGTPGRAGEVRLVELNSSSARAIGTTTDLILALAFSPDGSKLVTGGADSTIRVYDVASGKEQRRLEQHADWVMNVAFSPDGTHFASASRDKTARLFDARTGELEETYDGHANPVFAVIFSTDGKRLISAGRDKALHVWQAKDAKKAYEIGGVNGDTLRLIVHGEELFSAGTDHQVRQHRLGDKKAELTRTYAGHRDVVYTIALHGSTGRFATGSHDGEIRIWNAETGGALTNFVAAPGERPSD